MLHICSCFLMKALETHKKLTPSPGYIVVDNCWFKRRLSGVVADYKLCRDSINTASVLVTSVGIRLSVM